MTDVLQQPDIPLPAGADEETVQIVRTIYTDGITALKGAFAREWAQQLREDMDAAFEVASAHPGGRVGRGPHRYYVEIHPEQLRGFVDLVEHPWVRKVSEAVLGPDYRIVEVGFDVPFAGAVNQPWHRDFPMPDETRHGRRLTSLAFNLTGVDTEQDMGPFEIAPGTQWDDSPEFGHDMFPPRSHYPRYGELAVRKYPQMGDISVRSALTIHRGTRNFSQKSRPVLVLGVDAPAAGVGHHDTLAFTHGFWESLPERVKARISSRLVDRLEPITQRHTIEGLVMGET